MALTTTMATHSSKVRNFSDKQGDFSNVSSLSVSLHQKQSDHYFGWSTRKCIRQQNSNQRGAKVVNKFINYNDFNLSKENTV